MKFMQRKAEATRLEEAASQFEAGAAASVHHRSRIGPTILTDDTCDSTLQTQGRRVFTRKVIPAVIPEEQKTAEEKEADDWMAGLDGEDVWGDMGGGAEGEEVAEESGTAVAGEEEKPQQGRRFVVDGANRAPPLPKRLREQFEDKNGNAIRRGRRTESD